MRAAKRKPLWQVLVSYILFAGVGLASLVFLSGGLGTRADTETLALAAQSIRRAAVQCYALEGFYPADITYLREHYGVSIDDERYVVDYQFIASNLIPDIMVFAA